MTAVTTISQSEIQYNTLVSVLRARYIYLIISLVTLFFIYTNQYRLIGQFLMVLTVMAFGLLLIWRSFKLENLVAFLVSILPFVSIFRQYYFSYHGITILLLVVFLMVVLTAGDKSPLRSFYFNLLFALFVLFYLGSMLQSGNYNTNMRLLECILMGGLIMYLMKFRETSQQALLNLIIGAIVLSIGFMNQIENRFILEIIDDPDFGSLKLGNPIAMGLPLALSLILLVVEEGRWLGLNSLKLVRWSLFVICAGLLFVSTSRGATLVAVTAICLYMLLHRFNLIGVLFYGLLIYLAINMTQKLGYDLIASNYFDKALSSERDLSQRTTGRYDQYLVTKEAFLDKPIFGHGFGEGKKVYAYYSLNNPLVSPNRAGKESVLHSLYLQLIIEGGALFFVPFILSTLFLLKSNYLFLIKEGISLPTICLIGYLIIILSVTGNDPISGLFLGISMSFYKWDSV